MTGKIYKKLKEKDNYRKLKDILVSNLTLFIYQDDLFNLVEAMKVGTEILKKEGFPTKEFIIYATKK